MAIYPGCKVTDGTAVESVDKDRFKPILPTQGQIVLIVLLSADQVRPQVVNFGYGVNWLIYCPPPLSLCVGLLKQLCQIC